MDHEKDKKDIAVPGNPDLYNSSALIIKAHSDISLQRQSIIKRTEKIVTAIYLVSSLLPESDPLRLSLRNQSLDFLSFITDAVDFFQNLPPQHVADTVVSKTQSIISLLGISYFAGYVSEMNKNILVKELEWFAKEATEKGNFLLSGIVLEEGFFEPSPTHIFNQPKSGHAGVGARELDPRYKGQNKYPAVPHHKQKKSENSPEKVYSKRKSDRKEKVLEVVKKYGPLTIKGITGHVKDCSEKTIQRELVALIKDKIIKRSGERRWSVYSMA